jgi:hypothetical protein
VGLYQLPNPRFREKKRGTLHSSFETHEEVFAFLSKRGVG